MDMRIAEAIELAGEALQRVARVSDRLDLLDNELNPVADPQGVRAAFRELESRHMYAHRALHERMTTWRAASTSRTSAWVGRCRRPKLLVRHLRLSRSSSCSMPRLGDGRVARKRAHRQLLERLSHELSPDGATPSPFEATDVESSASN